MRGPAIGRVHPCGVRGAQPLNIQLQLAASNRFGTTIEARPTEQDYKNQQSIMSSIASQERGAQMYEFGNGEFEMPVESRLAAAQCGVPV